MSADLKDPIFSTEETPENNVAGQPATPPQKPSILIQLIKGLCYFVAFFAAQYVASFILATIFSAQQAAEWASAGHAITQEELQSFITAKLLENSNLLVIVYTIILMLFLLIFFAIRRKNFLQEIHAKKLPKGSLPALLVLPIGLALLINSVLNLLPEAWISDYAESSAPLLGMSAAWIAMLSNAICAPLSEEITFRGLMLSRFNKALPRWAGILLTSIIFGLVHGQVIWIFYATIMGLIFGFVAEYEGTILASLILHCIFNLIGTGTSYLGLPASAELFIIMAIAGLILTALGLFLLLRRSVKPAENAI